MTKNIFLKLGTVFIALLSGAMQSNAEAITYYFTGATDDQYRTVTNWNTERDGNGTEIPDITVLEQTTDVTLIIPSGKTANTGKSVSATVNGHLIIEDEGILENYFPLKIYGKVTIESGGIFNCPRSGIDMYTSASMEIAGTLNIVGTSIRVGGADASQSNISIEVKPGGIMDVAYIRYNVNLINNGTIRCSIVDVASIEGTGSLRSTSSITVADVAGSTFLQAGGGSIIYTWNASPVTPIALLSSYSHLQIESITRVKPYAGSPTVYGNLSLVDNTGEITLSDTVDVRGDLNIENSKVITGKVIKVAGNVSTPSVIDGSVVNITLTGTEQNMQGSGINNLEIPAGTTVTLTGDLTVINLVNEGVINENGHTLTVLNQAEELQGIIDDIPNRYQEADYTVESWAALQAAIAEAQGVIDSGNATTLELITAKSTVTVAVAALVTNLSALESWLNGIKTGYANPTVYTEATYIVLQEAIASVETFLVGKEAITVSEVEGQKAAINTTIAALVRMTYTFYLLNNGASTTALNYQAWNTERDGSGIQAVAFTPENTGHTYIIPTAAGEGRNSIYHAQATNIYDGRLILEAGESTAYLAADFNLHGSDFFIEEGRSLHGNVNTYGDGDTIRIKPGATMLSGGFGGDGGDVIVDEGGAINASFGGAYRLTANGSLELGGSTLTSITGTGAITANGVITLSDLSASTFLQAGGGSVIYKAANNQLLPSYNHLTIEDITAAATFVRTEEEATPPLTVYGNLLLRNNMRRVTVTNPIEVRGDFTVDYDIDDEAVVQAKVTVSGNVSLGGLLAEDNGLEITLSGDASHELSGAGATKLSVPVGATATLAGDFSVEDVLTVNGVLDRNGRQLTFGSRGGDGVITDGTVAARLQELLDEVSATYPDGSAYTEESWSALSSAVEGGSALLGNDVPSEADDLQAAITAIESAVAGLEIRTGIEGLSVPAVRVTGDASGIRIVGDAAADVQVVTLTGAVRFRGRVAGDEVIAVPTGVYVVAVNGTVRKVVVR